MTLHQLFVRTTLTGTVVVGYVTQIVVAAPTNCAPTASSFEYCAPPAYVAGLRDDEGSERTWYLEDRGSMASQSMASQGVSGISVPYDHGVSVDGNAHVAGFRVIPTYPNPSDVPKPPERIPFRILPPRDG
jgi:hypothetical protein